jgi:hypothetical protein
LPTPLPVRTEADIDERKLEIRRPFRRALAERQVMIGPENHLSVPWAVLDLPRKVPH